MWEDRAAAVMRAVTNGDGHGGAAGMAGLPADGLERQVRLVTAWR